MFIVVHWKTCLMLFFLLQVNKAPKRNSLTPTITPEDDQNSSKLSINDGDESSPLNRTQNRPLPDIITNVQSNNGIYMNIQNFE